ncbi:hypothetical protein [Aliidiomarina sanyensis]|nr:hypothetical protein [Aliidiomarina sanyensis]
MIEAVSFSALALLTSSALAIDREMECSNVANQIFSIDDGYLVAPNSIQHKRTINTEGPIYAAVGEIFHVRGRKSNFCRVEEIEDLANCLFDYSFGNSNRYAWWEHNGQGGTKFLGGFSDSRNLYYVPSSRGAKSIISVVTDKYYTTNPLGSVGNADLRIPVCDAIRVFAHELPIASAHSLQGGMTITAQSAPKIDNLSERGMQNMKPG